MVKSVEDPTTLFRSLRPEDSSFQTRATEAARDAEQRWPLFKAVSPRKPEPTPALSAQERLRWSSQDRPPAQEPKRALSLPDLGGRMAKSLSKMSGRTTPLADLQPVARAQREQPAVESTFDAPQISRERAAESHRSLFSRASSPDRDEEMQNESTGLFGKKPVKPITEKEESAAGRSTDDSFSNIFSRLEGKDKSVAKAPRKTSSFLGRLGKR